MTCEADRRRTPCMPTTPASEVEVLGQIGPWSHRIEPMHQHAPLRVHVLCRSYFPGFLDLSPWALRSLVRNVCPFTDCGASDAKIGAASVHREPLSRALY